MGSRDLSILEKRSYLVTQQFDSEDNFYGK